MTDNHTCYMCGRPVTPCANCGGTTGHMILASNHSDTWIHERQVDCIVHLNSELKKARARVTELEAFLSAYDDKPSQPKPGDFVAGWVLQADGTTRAYRMGQWPATIVEEQPTP